MPYYTFGPDDLIYNTVRVHPRQNFFIYQSAIYHNNKPELLAERGATTVDNVPVGYVNLYEMNVDRPAAELIYPFITKNGSLSSFKTLSTSEFNSDFQYGDTLTGSYPLSASISRTYYASGVSSRDKLVALQQTLDFYKKNSPHYSYSSSLGDKSTEDVNIISIPSIFYMDAIQKRTMELNFYITGTLVARLKDEAGNGELRQVAGKANDLGASYGSGSIAGVVLYNEGFVVLTGSWDLDPVHTDSFIGSNVRPKWIYYGVGAERSGLGYNVPNSSFELKFSGSNTIPRVTMFAHAERNKLNYSQNPTFLLTSSMLSDAVTGSSAYLEHSKKEAKNTVSGAYGDVAADFKKQTYISKIGIYDEDMKLIAVAKLATPAKKTEERDLTFKLKLDI